MEEYSVEPIKRLEGPTFSIKNPKNGWHPRVIFIDTPSKKRLE